MPPRKQDVETGETFAAPPPPRAPQIGDIVVFVQRGTRAGRWPAIVTAVLNGGRCDLTVFKPGIAGECPRNVPRDETGYELECWQWLERG